MRAMIKIGLVIFSPYSILFMRELLLIAAIAGPIGYLLVNACEAVQATASVNRQPPKIGGLDSQHL